MSNLSNRTSRRKISRSNAERAIRRIEREIKELIAHSPLTGNMPIHTAITRESFEDAFKSLRALYARVGR